MFEFFKNGTKVEIHWMAAILEIIAVYLLVCLFNFIRIRSVLKSFQKESSDEKFINKCIRLKRQFYSRKDKKMYNMFCTVLAATALLNKQYDVFFDNLNDLKNLDNDTSIRLYILLLAYVTGEKYVSLWNEYREGSDSKIFQITQVINMYKKYEVDKTVVVATVQKEDFVLRNGEVKEVLYEFVNNLN